MATEATYKLIVTILTAGANCTSAERAEAVTAVRALWGKERTKPQAGASGRLHYAGRPRTFILNVSEEEALAKMNAAIAESGGASAWARAHALSPQDVSSSRRKGRIARSVAFALGLATNIAQVA